MIFLIGGPPRSGKTTLAKKLARRLQIGWVPVDVLEAIVTQSVPKNNRNRLFPKTALCEEAGWENDPLYLGYPVSHILKAYIRQGYASRKAIETFVEHAIQENHDYILEGHQIHPSLAAKLIKRYPKSIRALFIVKTDVPLILKGFKQNVRGTDWVTQKTKDQHVLNLIAQMLSRFGLWVEKQTKRYKLTCVHVDRRFASSLSKAVTVLARRARA